MKVLTIVGARPQFVKLGPFSRELRKNHEELILHTGQHYDTNMSDSFFEDLEIPKPDFNLMVGSGSHASQTARMLEGIEKVMTEVNPHWLVVFGDTNSTLAGSLVAAKQGVRCAHIEAGLRSFNKAMPEEINRIISDHTADLLFAPSELAMKNLENEGLIDKSFYVGDIMTDSVEFVRNKIDKSPINGPYDVLTLHRPYNVDDKSQLKLIIDLISTIERDVIFAVHPRTRIKLNDQFPLPANLILKNPMGYIEFQSLIFGANRVITDSGGLQKEAYLYGKPCLTIRSETEWVETLDSGWNMLVDVREDNIANAIQQFSPPKERPNLYGSDVARKIVLKMAEMS